MKIDQYESQFKSAIKERYSYCEPALSTVVLISDLPESQANELYSIAQRLLPDWAVPDWKILSAEHYSSVKELLDLLNTLAPDLIVSQRNIKTSDDNLVYGLSDYTDALTQVTACPVLLLPDFDLASASSTWRSTEHVLVQTDHITGDHHLISWACAFARPNGTLQLIHIEDDVVFNYYIAAISRIPEIPTDVAEQHLRTELIKVPTEYIAHTTEVLKEQFPQMQVSGTVCFGHSLQFYKDLIARQRVDLLVLNTKVDGQLAMSGRAYALAVELKQQALLLL